MLMMPDEDDKDFIQRLFLENEMAMFVTARRMVKDYHTARDMVSESCITIITNVRSLRKVKPDKRTSYIITIVRNNSRMYLRKRKRERKILAESGYMFDDRVIEIQKSVDSRLIAEAEMQMLKEALAKIHKRDKEPLDMKYFAKLSDEQIGEAMGIGTASVRFYLTKARRSLEEELVRREAE